MARYANIENDGELEPTEAAPEVAKPKSPLASLSADAVTRMKARILPSRRKQDMMAKSPSYIEKWLTPENDAIFQEIE